MFFPPNLGRRVEAANLPRPHLNVDRPPRVDRSRRAWFEDTRRIGGEIQPMAPARRLQNYRLPIMVRRAVRPGQTCSLGSSFGIAPPSKRNGMRISQKASANLDTGA